MPRADEKKIAQFDLVSDIIHSKNKVTILQRSDSHFRIVIESVTDDHRDFIDKIYVATEDKLIPRYALPFFTTPEFEIAIYSRGEELLYRFHSLDDAFLFQSSLVGYEVRHHTKGIKCGFSDKSINSTGDIQIWQDPVIDLKSSQDSQSMPLLTLASSNSTNDSRSNTRLSSIATSISATTVSRIPDGFQAKPIAYPAITIFTRLPDESGRSRLALVYLKLDKDIRVFTEQCGCKDVSTYDQCAILSIERPKRARFPVYVLYSDLDTTGLDNPNTWDLSPFRIPEHPRFRKLRRVETTFLMLQFPSLIKKKNFQEELNDRFKLRHIQILEQADFLKRMRHRQDRPSRNGNGIPQPDPHSRSTSFASISTTEAAAPAQLKELDLGIDFQNDIEKSYLIQSNDNDDSDDDPTPAASQILPRPANLQPPTTRPTMPTATSKSSKKSFGMHFGRKKG